MGKGWGGSKSVCFLPLAPDSSGAVGRPEINAQVTMLRVEATPRPAPSPWSPNCRAPVSALLNSQGRGRGVVSGLGVACSLGEPLSPLCQLSLCPGGPSLALLPPHVAAWSLSLPLSEIGTARALQGGQQNELWTSLPGC